MSDSLRAANVDSSRNGTSGVSEPDYWQDIGGDIPKAGRDGLVGAALDAQRFKGKLPLRREIGQDSEIDKLLPKDFLQDSGTVFAVLDAGCLDGLVGLVEAERLTHESLFSGELAETAREAAPFIVELPQGSNLLRYLLTTKGDGSVGAGALWGAQAGMFIRSTLSLPRLRQHLRRFLRVLDPEGSAHFFRFWQPECAELYFSGLAERPATAARWFFPHGMKGWIEALWLPVRNTDGEEYLVHILPATGLNTVEPEAGFFQLAHADIEAFRLLQWRRDVARISDQLLRAFPERAKTMRPSLPALTEATMRRVMAKGFYHLDMLYMFCAWELHYGPGFENRDVSGAIAALMSGDGAAEWRFARIKDAMMELEAQQT
jgi:hypothetical protein